MVIALIYICVQLMVQLFGTAISPLDKNNGETIAQIAYHTYAANSYRFTASVRSSADENHDGGGWGSNLSFWTTTNRTASILERMIIKNDGDVGIGTSNPSAKLDVDGAIKVGNSAATATAGMIRWNGTNFQGYNGTSWVNLDIIKKDIVGETIALSGLNANFLIKNDADIKRVYKINSDGSTTIYTENTDYVKVAGGGLRRTTGSSIPDFSTHTVIYNPDGTFTFNASPRNPQELIPLQIMVDYNTNIDVNVSKQDNFLSATLRNKISSADDIKLMSIGTSISAGAHTLPRYYNNLDTGTYLYHVADAINKLYGSNTTVQNFSQNGSVVAHLTTNINNIIAQDPDILFIEFGMNEHSVNHSVSDMNTTVDEIETSIQQLQAAGIDCVVIGFFQRNKLFDIESVPNTIYLNNKLETMAARNNAFFADVYTYFNSFSDEKRINDFTGAFIHHPTDFGHKLYYLTIMPFILPNDTTELELLRLIN